MAITDLTGTYWIIDKLPKYGDGQAPWLGSKSITFINDNETYYGLWQTQEAYYEVVLDYKTSPSGSNYIKVFDGRQYDGWDDTVYQDIYITGGTDVTNSDLISFLETYATEGTQIDYLTTDRELNSVANAIRTKGGTSSLLTYPNGFITAINNLPTGATLQSKTVNPSTASQTVSPDSGYDGLSSVTVNAMPSGSVTAPSLINGSSATIDTSPTSIALQKTISITPDVTTAGYISSGTPRNSLVTLSANCNTKGATTYTPTTTNQSIAANTYLTGIQTISGDTNLKASNIKNGVSIFGITGSYTGGGSSSAIESTLLGSLSLGTISTSSTTDTDTGKTITVKGIYDYDLLVCQCRTSTPTNGRHTCTTRLCWLTASSSIETKNGSSFATATWNTKKSSSGVTTSRTNTTSYGVYAKAATVSAGSSGDNGQAVITIYQRYNSTQTGTINGSYTMYVYGLKIYDLLNS